MKTLSTRTTAIAALVAIGLLAGCSNQSPDQAYLRDLGSSHPDVSDSKLVSAGHSACDVLETLKSGPLAASNADDQVAMAASALEAVGLDVEYATNSAKAALKDLCPENAVK